MSGTSRRWWRRALLATAAVLVLGGAGLAWWVAAKQPQRSGERALAGLSAPVTVRFDDWGVPHLQAQNEDDLYRTLGWLHAQDRLFQMEMLRRLARGELAEVLGPKLVETDRLFRTLGIREHADRMAARQFAPDTPFQARSASQRALIAYLDGINQYQASRPAPLEFELLGIPKRPFTPADTLSVAGYLAYSFAAAFRTEPALTYIRDQLGPDYLKIFDLDWKPAGVLAPPELAPELPDVPATPSMRGASADPARRAAPPRQDLAPLLTRLAELGLRTDALAGLSGLPQFEGSNAWVLAGSRTASGKPLLAGDPHIAYSAPAVWWEAHLKAPGFELYGHHLGLTPVALLGHGPRAGWTLTMFQNDDLDLVLEKTNPGNPDQVWVRDREQPEGRWVTLTRREEILKVKGQPDQTLVLRRSPHGPIVNDAVPGAREGPPIAMWWAFLETENPVLDAFHQLARADTLEQARHAASLIHAPGLNVLWANAAGDIGWWAAARLPIRPEGVNPAFILDGASAEADKPGFLPFSANPQEENPARGYIVSANHQPAGLQPVPGYYNLPERARRLDGLLSQGRRWDIGNSQALQLDVQTDHGPRLLSPLLPLLRAAAATPEEQALVEKLSRWNGAYTADGLAPVLFQQLLMEIVRGAMLDELGEAQFENLRRTRALDQALPRLLADADSPWWDRRGTPARETRADVVRAAWPAALAHLRQVLGPDSGQWRWGRAHTLTHLHALGRQAPLDRVFNIGPLAVPGGHEVPNNFAQRLGDAPWPVLYGPSTRRLVDFAKPEAALGVNPVGQSGVWPDRHYRDQAALLATGRYRPQWLAEADVAAHTRGTLVFKP